ncbi:MAG: hypothetical protein M0R17_03335 [Candidatus Omnitrophica bacterium]|jgi:hypothetical protein|nr:hypothetical protein [Candidatus Omnitrophota bacterium]
MKEYITYRIINKDGNSIGKQDFYTSLGKASYGSRHVCSYYLDEHVKIVKIKVIEEIVEEFPINITSTKTFPNGTDPNRKYVETYNFDKKEEEKSTGIIFK